MDGDPEVKKEAEALIVQLKIPKGTLDSTLAEGVRAKLLNGSIEYMIRELTPEMMHSLAADVIAEALKGLNSWELRKKVEVVISPMLDEILKRPEVIGFVRKKVEEGVNLALDALPNEVKTKVVERAVNGMIKAWEQKDRY